MVFSVTTASNGDLGMLEKPTTPMEVEISSDSYSRAKAEIEEKLM
jgi:hypothetical protein